jgi:hypothetical protein
MEEPVNEIDESRNKGDLCRKKVIRYLSGLNNPMSSKEMVSLNRLSGPARVSKQLVAQEGQI